MSLSSWLKVVEKVAPVVLSVTPLAPIAPFVTAGVQIAEGIPGATSEQKLAIATQIVNAGVAATNAQAGKQVVDPVGVNAAVTSGINAVVATANLVKDPDGDGK